MSRGLSPRVATALIGFVTGVLGPASFPASTHDFWIEPGSFDPLPGAVVPVRLRVGEHLIGDPVARDQDLIIRFAALRNGRELPIAGMPGQEPAGLMRPVDPGLYVLVYASRPSPVNLEAAKFEKYLAEEGLERILQLRESRGEKQKGGREVFSRCAKSIVICGDPERAARSGFDRPAGLITEIVPEADPTSLAPGGHLPLRLLFRGKPLSDALVTAVGTADPSARISGRTRADGRIVLALPAPGIWLVKSVQMVRASGIPGADWESFWASLTFRIPTPDSQPPR
ncbi:MAG: DUF4198 domain-containing protein [Acidobacteria bacterium]|nr:DUF4198 domain-containing protein [Acidobacteriota bacterium]